ncbi:hypothetical protein Tco_1266985 [Tanacetum coccineum]
MDQFAITRAAAWAWYERGSLLEHNLIRESDFKRKRDYKPRPSRYKLEAMKQQQKETHEAPSCINLGTGRHVEKSLLDRHEINRISKELDCYVGSSKVESIDGRDHGGRRTVSKETKSKTRSKKHNGFWMRHGLVCRSSSDDVVEHANLVSSRRHERKEDVSKSRVTNPRPPIILG